MDLADGVWHADGPGPFRRTLGQAFAPDAPLWLCLPMSPPLLPSSSLGPCTTGVGMTKFSLLLSMVAPRLLPEPMPPLAMGTKGTREDAMG